MRYHSPVSYWTTMKLSELYEWTEIAYAQAVEEQQKSKGEQEVGPGY